MVELSYEAADPQGPKTANATTWQANPWREMAIDVGNMLKAFIGLNFMYTAYAFSKAGLVRGVIGLLVITFATEHCCILLIQVKNAMPIHLGGEAPNPDEEVEDGDDTDSEPRVPTYGDIASFVGGRHAENIVNFALVLTQFGYCVGYLIFLSQTVHDIVHSHGHVWPFVLMPIPVLAALALLSSIRSLGPFSLLANLSLLVGFVAVVVFIARHFHWQPSHPPLTSFPLFFGQMTAALEGIGLVIPVENSMSNKKRFPMVLRLALCMLTTVLMSVGVLGFVTFGEGTRSIILLNFGSSSVVLFVKCVVILGILFTYPLQIIPVFQFFESLLKQPDDYQQVAMDEVAQSEQQAIGPGQAQQTSLFVRSPARIAIRLAVVVCTALVAILAGASFGLFQSLVGSLGASTLAYSAPALLHMWTFWGELSWFGKIKNGVIMIFGVLGSIVGTIVAVLEMTQIHLGKAKPV